MQQPEQPVRKPSIFAYSLAGYLIGNAFGIPAVIAMSIRAGDFNEQAAFQILVCTGAVGAMTGFEIAARSLKAFGGGRMEAILGVTGFLRSRCNYSGRVIGNNPIGNLDRHGGYGTSQPLTPFASTENPTAD
jgi:hypothetical protein